MHADNNKRLQELSSSHYAIAGGQPDIRGWKVNDTMGNRIGEVEELVFDAEHHKVRYMVIDLEGNALDLDPSTILVPIGLALLQKDRKEVVISDITGEQLSSLPDYNRDQLTAETESRIINVLGRAATLDMEAAAAATAQAGLSDRQPGNALPSNNQQDVKDAASNEAPDQPVPETSSISLYPDPENTGTEDTFTLETAPGSQELTLTDETSVPVNRTSLEMEEELRARQNPEETNDTDLHDRHKTHEDSAGNTSRKDFPDA